MGFDSDSHEVDFLCLFLLNFEIQNETVFSVLSILLINSAIRCLVLNDAPATRVSLRKDLIVIKLYMRDPLCIELTFGNFLFTTDNLYGLIESLSILACGLPKWLTVKSLWIVKLLASKVR